MAADPSTMEGNPNQSTAQQTTDDSLSTSSQMREEVIYTTTVEAELDESHHNYESSQKITEKDGDNLRLDEQARGEQGARLDAQESRE